MLGGEKERWRGYEVVRRTMKVGGGNKKGWGGKVGRKEGKDFIVDCHGFGVETSRLLVVWGLNVAYELGKGRRLVVIVGKGKGSKDGIPVVAIKILDFLLGGEMERGAKRRADNVSGRLERSDGRASPTNTTNTRPLVASPLALIPPPPESLRSSQNST